MQTSSLNTQPLPLRINSFITGYWLVAGYLALLTGLFWATDGSQYTKLFYGLVAAPALIALLLSPGTLKLMLREPIILAYLAFAAWLLLSLLWTHSDRSVGGLAKRPLYVFMMFAACTLMACHHERRLLKVLQAGALLSVLAALGNLYLYFSASPAEERLIGTGALSNPLLTSHVLGFFCTYWVAAWLTQSQRWDWLPVLCAIPLLVALLATGSRTPLLALTLASLWMLVMTPRRGGYLIAALLVAAAVGFLAMPELFLERGLSFRPQLWADALSQATAHPWLGHGYESKFVFDIPGVGRLLSDPHNVELAVLLELGLIGLTLWLVLYGATLLRCLHSRKNTSLQLASALVVYGLAAGLTEGSAFLSRPNENWFLIWIPLSLVAALSIQQRQLGRP